MYICMFPVWELCVTVFVPCKACLSCTAGCSAPSAGCSCRDTQRCVWTQWARASPASEPNRWSRSYRTRRWRRADPEDGGGTRFRSFSRPYVKEMKNMYLIVLLLRQQVVERFVHGSVIVDLHWSEVRLHQPQLIHLQTQTYWSLKLLKPLLITGIKLNISWNIIKIRNVVLGSEKKQAEILLKLLI